MVQYYTLEEAAKVLKTTADQLKLMAKKGEVRAFQDRGNLRFRSQEVDELARSKGMGSDPELQIGESIPLSEGPATPRVGPKLPPPSDEGEFFDFTLSTDESSKVPLANQPPGGGNKSGSPSSSTRRKQAARQSTLKAPPPMVSSDSDVRLVSEGSDLDFKIADDPAAKGSPSSPRSPAPGKSRTPSKVESSKSKLDPPSKKDSDVPLVPKDQAIDSDVQLVGAAQDSLPLGMNKGRKPSDSDIRMDHGDLAPPASSMRKKNEVITEEIDLDAEFEKAQQGTRAKGGSASSGKGPSGKGPSAKGPSSAKSSSAKGPSSAKSSSAKGKSPQLPTSSPFELSEADIDLDKPKKPQKAPPSSKSKQQTEEESSEEFTLSPMPSDDSSTESPPLDASSDEVPLLMGDDEVSLGELTGAGGGSGINLQLPADSGISLEQGGSDEIEFELSLDPSGVARSSSGKADKKQSGKTALGKNKPPPQEEASEFDLSLNEEGEAEGGSDSEFELTLDGEDSVEAALEKPSDSDSDSEFELTLDEGGELGADEEAGGEEKDIFETDFEVPALEDESGSEAMALESDTDVETSDFDLGGAGDESDLGSQVVDLEDEEADAGAATVKRPSRGARAAVADEAEVEEDAEELLDEDDGPRRIVAVEAPPAEWGALPAMVLLPCVLVLFIVGLMGFELVQGMWGYQRGAKIPGLVIHPIAQWIDPNVPD